MKLFQFFLAIALFLPALLYSQYSFKPGYVVTKSGDTIHGFIDFKGYTKNSYKCVFKAGPDDNSMVKTYSPEELKSYRFNDGKYYISVKFNDGEKEQELFLEYLIHGKLDVLCYRDMNTDEHYLVRQGNGSLTYLRNDERDRMVDGVTYRVESKQYIGILKLMMSDSPESANEAEGTILNHKSLIKLAKDYHQAICKDEECIIYEKNIPRVKIFLGPVGGINMNKIGLLKNNFPPKYYYFSSGKWQWCSDPSAGLLLKFVFPLLNDKFSLEYECMINRLTNRLNSNLIEATYGYWITDDIQWTQYCLNNVLLLKYEFLNRKVSPYIEAGIFVNYAFSTTYSRHHIIYDTDGTMLDDFYDTESPFSKLVIAPAVGGGMTVKTGKKAELFLDVRYYAGFGIFSNLFTNTIAVTVGFPVNIF